MKMFGLVLVMPVLILALGLAFIGCKTEAEDDPLNGIWRTADGLEITLNNGYWNLKMFSDDQQMKGTYTVRGSSLVLTTTDIHFGAYTAAKYGTTVGWRNKSQATEFFRQAGFTDAEINEQFGPFTWPYTLNGNTLILGLGYGPTTFTRQ
jgi:hypothetical protein